MKDWYSGLMPYRYLLPAQIAIIVLMVMMIGQLDTANRELARALVIFAAVYALAMVVRLVVLRRSHPEYRW